MKYDKYITKKRMKTLGICGHVNIPWGTVLDVHDDFILHQGNRLCAVTSANAKKYFWGYDAANPEKEIARQKIVFNLLNSAPMDNGNELSDPLNPWRRFGELQQMINGNWLWVWNESIKDLPQEIASHLLSCAEKGTSPLI